MNKIVSINKPITREKFLEDIEAFCEKEKIALSAVGKKIFNDTAFYTKVKNGRSPTLERVEEFYDYVANYGQGDLFT